MFKCVNINKNVASISYSSLLFHAHHAQQATEATVLLDAHGASAHLVAAKSPNSLQHSTCPIEFAVVSEFGVSGVCRDERQKTCKTKHSSNRR